MTSKTSFDFLAISDVHLGHRRNPSAYIAYNLKLYLTEQYKKKSYDMVIVAGDLFDSLLTFLFVNQSDIVSFCNWLLGFCLENKIILRVLEGTPSHDWKQSTIFSQLLLSGKYEGIDFKYHHSLGIEYMPQWGMNFLYVPDEWAPTTDKTLEQVKQLLSDKGLSKVDFSIMHGQFADQIPGMKNSHLCHDQDEYENLTDQCIFIGHVHKHSTRGKRFAQGSFERLSHGEEENKGFLRASCDIVNRKTTVKFIVNKRALPFVTLDLLDTDYEEALSRLNALRDDLEKWRTDSLVEQKYDPLIGIKFLVRLRAYKGHAVLENLDNLSESLGLVLTKDVVLLDSDTEQDELIVDEDYKPIHINKNNLMDLVVSEVTDKYLDLNIETVRSIVKTIM